LELGGGWEILGWFVVNHYDMWKPQYFFDREEIAAQRAGEQISLEKHFRLLKKNANGRVAINSQRASDVAGWSMIGDWRGTGGRRCSGF
jgi:hypothetical protein